MSAAMLAAGGCGAWTSDSGQPSTGVLEPDGGGGELAAGIEPTLSWRMVDGTVSPITGAGIVTTGEGVTYALSTAPGARQEDAVDGRVPGAIYRTSDGETWESALIGDHRWNRLAEHDGVLYAVATAPGASGPDASASASVGVSTDAAETWTETELPVEITRPQTSAELYANTAVSLGVTSDVTAALVTGSFSVDPSRAIASKLGDAAASAGWYQTPDGFAVTEVEECSGTEGSGTEGSDNTDPPVSRPITPKADEADLCETELGAVSWDDLDISDPLALQQQHLLLSSDGSTWEEVPLPFDDLFTNAALHGTSSGLLLVATRYTEDGSALGGTSSTRIYHSIDGRSWAETASGANIFLGAVAGDRVIAEAANGSLLVSNDGGLTFDRENLTALIPHQGEAFVGRSAAGPLGFAAVFTVIEPEPGNADDEAAIVGPEEFRDYELLVTSTDGSSWTVTDLNEHGRPVDSWMGEVLVGANHIGVDIITTTETGGGQPRTEHSVLLGTPER
jgi:hypothetical protein